MIEIIIIAMVIGILAALAVPSFNSLYESIKVDQTIAELRTSISQSQRAAIRAGASCESSVLVQIQASHSSFQPDVSTSCDAPPDNDIPDGVSIHTNLVATPMIDVLGSRPALIASSGTFDVDWHHRYYADRKGDDDDREKKEKKEKKKSWKKWNLENCEKWGGCSQDALKKIGFINFEYGRQGSIDYEIQNNPVSSTGTIVATSSQSPSSKMKCLAISRRIGLTRVGFYTGQLTPEAITKEGQCTTVEWNKQ